METREIAVTFSAANVQLCGIVHLPCHPAPRGILMLSARPQYRIGSQRQSVLLARRWAENGIPVMRFDYAGMGDSLGQERSWDEVDGDIVAAVDTFFFTAVGLQEIVLWGLCTAASVGAVYAAKDRRVRGITLVNPLVLDEQAAGLAYLRHYYWPRIWSAEFWRKVAWGRLQVGRALGRLIRLTAGAAGSKRLLNTPVTSTAESSAAIGIKSTIFQSDRILTGIAGSQGPVLLVLCGRDMIARVFHECAVKSKRWQELVRNNRVTRHDLPEAEHTFPRSEWREQVAVWTMDWLQSW